MMIRKRQQGVALIVILMLLAIMTTIAGSMSERLFTQFKRSGNQVNYQQAYWYSLGVEALAVVGIEQSFKDGDTINLNQPWAVKNQVYPLDYGQASGHIVDKQACFNINVLSRVTQNATSVTRPYLLQTWQHLLEAVEVEPYQAEVIADSTWEYIRTSKTVQSQTGVGDSTYESMKPAYVAPHHLMADSSELRAVYQMGGDIYQKLKPMVCALPSDDWRLNINTIEPEQAPLLVAMFSPNLSKENALTLIAERPLKGWKDINGFLNEPELAGLTDASKKQVKAYLGVDSSFFELDTQILVDQSRIRLRSLLSSQDRKTVTVVRRRFGGISERVVSRSAE